MTLEFRTAMQAAFPGSIPAADYLDTVRSSLGAVGFDPETTLPLVSICRDELTTNFFARVQEQWGPAFTLAGLAAFVSLFIAAGMLVGTRQHEADVLATQALADAQAFDAKTAAKDLPLTRLGWLGPPRLRRGATAEGERVVAFPLSGSESPPWRYRRAGSDAWATSTSAPPVDRFEDGAP